MSLVKIETLTFDESLYPRTQIDSTHVTGIMLAMKAGAQMPPIQVDRKTKRVIDGFHRGKAHIKLGLETIDVEWVNCKDDQHFYALAVEANAGHGRPFSPFDRARIQQRAEELGFSIERVSQILRVPIESLQVQRKTVFAQDEQGQPVPLKRTIAWKAGQTLSVREIQANKKLSGMNATFTVNQLLELFEAELIDWNNDALVQGLGRLYGHLRQHSATFKKAA